MKAFAVLLILGVALVSLAGAVTYTSYTLSDLDCTDVARLAGIDFANGGDNDDENHLIMGPEGDLFINLQYAGSLTVPRDLPYDDGAKVAGQVATDDITEWNGHEYYLVVASEDGFYGFGLDAETPLDNNQQKPRQGQIYLLTHLVPIGPDGVDDSRDAIELSIPINIGGSSLSAFYLFAGHNEVGLFASNQLNLPQFSHVDLLTGEVTIVPTFLQIEDDICRYFDNVATGVYEKTTDGSFTVLCATLDGIVRLTNTGNIDGYAWGPFEMEVEMHDVAADWFRPENGTFYFKSDGYSEGAWFGDVYYPDSQQTVISCRATYNVVEESGDGDGDGDGDGGDGDAASTLSAALFDIQKLF